MEYGFGMDDPFYDVQKQVTLCQVEVKLSWLAKKELAQLNWWLKVKIEFSDNYKARAEGINDTCL